jgi:hypothetical protein
MTSPDYRFRFNNYGHPNLTAAFDMSTLTPGGLMKNMTGDSTYDATINGTLVLANPLIRAKKTKCMDFDGLTNYLSLSNPINLLTNWTILFWINSVTTGNVVPFVSSVGIQIPSSKFRAFNPGVVVETPDKIVTNSTYLWVVTHTASNLKEYVFGRGRLETSQGGPGAPGSVASALIGEYTGGVLLYSGLIDNMLFYNIALTPSQIQSIFRSSVPR